MLHLWTIESKTSWTIHLPSVSLEEPAQVFLSCEFIRHSKDQLDSHLSKVSSKAPAEFFILGKSIRETIIDFTKGLGGTPSLITPT